MQKMQTIVLLPKLKAKKKAAEDLARWELLARTKPATITDLHDLGKGVHEKSWEEPKSSSSWCPRRPAQKCCRR